MREIWGKEETLDKLGNYKEEVMEEKRCQRI